MATASFLDTPNPLFIRESKYKSLKWNPLLQTFPTRIPPPFQLMSRKESNFSVKCVMGNKKWGFELKEKEKDGFKVEKVMEMILKALQKPAVAAIMLGLLLSYDPHSALAASGGRMAGNAFSKHSSSSKSYSASIPSPSCK